MGFDKENNLKRETTSVKMIEGLLFKAGILRTIVDGCKIFA